MKQDINPFASPPWRTFPYLARLGLSIASLIPMWAMAGIMLTLVAVIVVLCAALVLLVAVAYPFLHLGWGMQTERLIPNNRAKAPWPDFKGVPIFEGDTIRHPTGERGKVIFFKDQADVTDQWMVDYGDGHAELARLVLQVGDKGKAEVIE